MLAARRRPRSPRRREDPRQRLPRGAGTDRPTLTLTDSGAVDQPGSALQRTTIRPRIPGSGKDSASASTASRAARERRRQDWTVTVASARRHVPTISPSTRTATRPDARGPERATTIGVGDQEFAIGSLEEEVGVAAREEPCGRRGPRGGAERRLVAGEDPRVADRCSHRGQRPAERVERRDASPRARSPPTRRTPRAWWDRRRAGTGARARGERRAGRSRVAARSRWWAAARRPNGSRPCRSARRT